METSAEEQRVETRPYQQVAAALIVKDEAKYIDRILDNILPHVDGVFIYDTGSTDGTQEMARAKGARVTQGEWRNDFAWARNQSYSLVGEEFDWIVYFDADDTVQGLENLRTLANDALRETDSFSFPYLNDWTGIHVNYSTKRLVRRSAGYRWCYPLHEKLVLDGGMTNDKIFEVENDTIIWSQKHTMEDRQRKTQRNLEVLLAQPTINAPDEWLAAGVVFTMVEQGRAREAASWLSERHLVLRIVHENDMSLFYEK